MAEEWVKDARNKARLTNNLHTETGKALVIANQKNKKLDTKLATEERGRRNVKASLKNAQDQAEKQRKKLHYAGIKLATTKQEVMNLKAELEKPKEAAQVAKAAADALEQKFYDLGVQETKAHLTEELVEVCREFCQKMWIEALNLVGVPAASE